MIPPLQPPDSLHFKAAEGWLGLGDHIQAKDELEKITAAAHPDVLELRWKTCASSHDWGICVEVAEQLVKVAPERVSGWLMKSIALHGRGRIQEAFDSLLPAVQKFPHVSAISYDLACYACRLDRLSEARKWLSRALEGEDSERWREMAKQDSDLKVLREQGERL